MADIADAAMGIAISTTISPEEDFTTMEMKISFYRPHIKGPLRAEGIVAKRGRRVGFAEAVLTNENHQIVAIAVRQLDMQPIAVSTKASQQIVDEARAGFRLLVDGDGQAGRGVGEGAGCGSDRRGP